jgi:hypothetical protein
LGEQGIFRLAGDRHARIDDHHGRATRRQVLGDRKADASGAPGDDGNAVLELHAHPWA